MKEIFASQLNILYDEESCLNCGLCSRVCSTGKIHPGDEKRPEIDNGYPCIACGHCIAVCPSEALSTDTPGFEYPVTRAYRSGIDPAVLSTYLKSRRSFRIWKDKTMPREILQELIGIAAYAPSACNIRPVKWIVVADPEKIKDFVRRSIEFLRTIPPDHPVHDQAARMVMEADHGTDPICRGAPALLIAATESDEPFFREDSVISLSLIDIYAPSIGIGTCWVGFVLMILALQPELGKILGIPGWWKPQAAMIAGYRGVTYSRIPPRERPEIVWV